MDFSALDNRPTNSFEELTRVTKLRLLQMHYESRVGHIGGNLSALDLLLALYHKKLGSDDSFVLSKGHAAGALYATLWSKGLLSEDDLRTFTRMARGLAVIPIPGNTRDFICNRKSGPWARTRSRTRHGQAAAIAT